MPQLAASQILGKRSRVLVEIDLDGFVLRFTTDPNPVTVFDSSGVPCDYQPGMDSVSIDVTSTQLRNAMSVTIKADPSAESWADLRARGYRFELARAVVRHHYDGDELGDARVVLRGDITSPSYGASGEPFSFSLQRRLRQAGLMPGPSMQVDVANYPAADPEIIGTPYPLVIGRPGKISGGVACPVTPALLVIHISTVSPANMWIINAAESFPGTATLHNVTTGESLLLTVQIGTDPLGQVITFFDSAVWSASFLTVLGDEYRVAWDGTAGGVMNDDRSAPIEGAAEITLYLFEAWAPRVLIDRARMISEVLDGFRFGFAITEVTDPWSFIQAHILPVVPAEMRESDDGLWLEYVNLRAGPVVAEWHLIATEDSPDKNCTRKGTIRAGNGRIVNRVRVKYAVGGKDQRHLNLSITDAEDKDNLDPNVHSSMLADISQGVHGVQEVEIESSIIYEDATAEAVGESVLLQGALPRRQLTVVGGLDLDAIEVGSIGEYTEAGVHMAAVLVMLRAKDPREAQVTHHLLVLDDYVQSRRITQ